MKERLIVDSWRKVMNAQYIDKDLPRGFQSRENSSFPIDRLSSEGMSTRCRHAQKYILNFRIHTSVLVFSLVYNMTPIITFACSYQLVNLYQT